MMNEPQSRSIPLVPFSPRLPLHSMHLLLADDDLDFLSLAAESLRKDGYLVDEVSDGLELLRRSTADHLHAAGIDVIISDVLMPGASGMSMLMQINQMKSPPPVVMITGCRDTDVHLWAQQLGAVAVFDKPFELDDLRTLLVNIEGYSKAHGGSYPMS